MAKHGGLGGAGLSALMGAAASLQEPAPATASAAAAPVTEHATVTAAAVTGDEAPSAANVASDGTQAAVVSDLAPLAEGVGEGAQTATPVAASAAQPATGAEDATSGAAAAQAMGHAAGADASDISATTQSVARAAPVLPVGITVDESGQLWADVARLQPNPQQPRQEFDEEKLRELADSIREHGIIEAIIVEDAGNGSFYIIAGERRTRAARMAGLERVPVQLRHYSEQKKLEVALIENIQRADLNAIEEAQAYYKLMELGGLNQEQVAARVGKNRSTVANAIRLLKLPEDMQAALVQGRLTAGHARALLAVNDSDSQRALFGKIVGNGMSVRQAEAYAAELNAGSAGRVPAKSSPAADTRDPDFAALEGQFRDALGTKVALKGSLERGTLVIDYFSRADLDRLYSIFTR